jgi:hypothetical protein
MSALPHKRAPAVNRNRWGSSFLRPAYPGLSRTGRDCPKEEGPGEVDHRGLWSPNKNLGGSNPGPPDIVSHCTILNYDTVSQFKLGDVVAAFAPRHTYYTYTTGQASHLGRGLIRSKGQLLGWVPGCGLHGTQRLGIDDALTKTGAGADQLRLAIADIFKGNE